MFEAPSSKTKDKIGSFKSWKELKKGHLELPKKTVSFAYPSGLFQVWSGRVGSRRKNDPKNGVLSRGKRQKRGRFPS